MNLLKGAKYVVNKVASGVGDGIKSVYQPIGNYLSNVASNPSIHSLTNGASKNTWLGESIDQIGQDYSVNQVFGGFKDLLRNVSGQQAQEQYEQSRQDSWDMFNEQMDYTKNQYKYMAEDMARAGLSPLSSLGASPASAPSGSPASPTASSSAGGLGAIASFISPILGAVVSRLNNSDNNATQKVIAGDNNQNKKGMNDDNNQTKKDIADAGNKSREKIAKDYIDANEPVKDATARNLNASADNQEYETDYNKKRGISSNTPDSFKVGKELLQAVSDVQEGIKSEQQDEILGKDSEEMKKEAKKMFDEAFPSKKPSWLAFESWYNTWAKSYAKNPISFYDFCSQNKKYGKYFKAWKSSRGQ